MTGGKRLRIAALFVIVLVFAFIMDMIIHLYAMIQVMEMQYMTWC